MPDSPVALIYDAIGQPVSAAYAPVTGRSGQATYSSQGGLMALGHDYGTSAQSGTAYAPKIDANGTVSVRSTSAVQAGTTVASANSVSGNVMLGLSGLTPTPVQIDAFGNLSAAPVSNATFSVYAQAVTLSSGKSLLAIMNRSTSSVLRIVAVHAQNTATSPSSLTTYSIFAEQMHFITGYSGGTALTPVSFDTADALASGITCSSAGTASGEQTPAIRRWISSTYPLQPGGTAAENTTGDQQGRDPWFSRTDNSAKPVTIRPGMGVHVRIASTVSTGAQDVTVIFTQAAS